ncbi:SEC-C motif domain protein [Chthoniobacter flavus Ellin428]|uniref:SEC-C motif domain protein n=1 Tax=Chthoniobacter flavus Ellin428 TaxID=497964 RepID=B4CXT4_9BACT|nr:DUF1186 domain-containing protein [Chthoniobacter flavus]EDY21082.1 SEC-C motif domain protein [Chthoniobacter flavus Ellin428]TCO88804.1 SEC-C motif-containing protein [Chthoniobacter flavus]
MTTEEVLNQFRDPGNAIPYEAMIEVIASPEEFVPVLIREIEVAAELADKIDPDDCLPAFALYLLAQLRESRALEPVLRYFALDEKTEMDLFQDVISTDGKDILAAIGRDRPERLREYALQPDLSLMVRTMVWDALVCQVQRGEQPREPLVAYFRELFASNAWLDDEELWSLLIAACLDLHPRELLEPIRGIYERDLVDTSFVGDFDTVEAEAARDPEEWRRSFVEAHPPLTDAAEAISWWSCFQPPDPFDDFGDDDGDGLGDIESDPFYLQDPGPPGEPFQRTEPKIGRNDLCPCGSGKKYKKCCLHKQTEGQ